MLTNMITFIVAVERTFGACKGMWQRILYVLTMMTTDHLRNIVEACMILYNYATLDRLGLLQSWMDGTPNWGPVDYGRMHLFHRDLQARADAMPRQQGEQGSERRKRAVLAGIVLS